MPTPRFWVADGWVGQSASRLGGRSPERVRWISTTTTEQSSKAARRAVECWTVVAVGTVDGKWSITTLGRLERGNAFYRLPVCFAAITQWQKRCSHLVGPGLNDRVVSIWCWPRAAVTLLNWNWQQLRARFFDVNGGKYMWILTEKLPAFELVLTRLCANLISISKNVFTLENSNEHFSIISQN